jgi:nicotinate-nucleotide--dimethylbenzimidazole phosphoribosyltransferase
MNYREIISGIRGGYAEALTEAQEHIDSLLKPPGSLGKLEEMAVRLSGITGKLHNSFEKRCHIVMAADNGVYAEGVASAPQEFTRLQAVNMTRGICGISVLARAAGADLFVVDIGIKDKTGCPAILDRNVRRGTDNMAHGPAMSREEAIRAIETGIAVTEELIEKGYEIIGTGEMGIGNTTSTSACAIVLTGVEIDRAVGRGAGLTDEALAHKIEIIKQAIEVNAPDPLDPIDVVSKVGGLDIAGLIGCYLAAAYHRKPILIDGVISAIAALIATRLAPSAADFMFATHRSKEPAYDIISEEIGIAPILDLDMRLGEGTGSALTFPIISAACAIAGEMGTFADIEYDESVLVDNRDAIQ